MKADDHQAPTPRKQLRSGANERPEAAEFVVHENPQRLERAGRWMDSAIATRRNGSMDHFGEYLGTLNRARMYDRSGNTSGARLFPVGEDQGGQVFLGIMIHDLCRRQFHSTVHSHIQRTRKLETEASFSRVELQGRRSQIGQNALAILDASLGGDGSHFGKIRLHQMIAPAKLSQSQVCVRQSFGIAVDAEKVDSLASFQQRVGVTTQTDRCIDEQTALSWPQKP